MKQHGYPPYATKAKPQQLILSDKKEQGLAGEDGGADGRKRMSRSFSILSISSSGRCAPTTTAVAVVVWEVELAVATIRRRWQRNWQIISNNKLLPFVRGSFCY
uniref:Uncharacterized protein n=1 Tax=Nelumbo nucifera TaxID=4432 RepID=A0A822ZH64_NELNU|nr:TPA_asm: hypothetical protein HUJ06_000606 [Nelumbo nucifera]